MRRVLLIFSLLFCLPTVFAKGVYGPTTARDDLWHVASEYQQHFPQTTVQQWMIAIYDQNKPAFQYGNMNGLMTGFRLHVPDVTQVRSHTNQEAGHLLANHNRAWRSGSKSPSATPGLSKSSNGHQNSVKAHLKHLDQEVMRLNHAFASIQSKLDGDYEKLYDESGQIQQSLAALNEHVMALNFLDDPAIYSQEGGFWAQLKAQWLAPSSLRVASVAAILLVLIMLWVLWTPRRSVTANESHDTEVDLGDEYDFMHSQEGIPARLDLARAYIGMDDCESAKEVLEAIIQDKPSESYREQAQAMLKEIS